MRGVLLCQTLDLCLRNMSWEIYIPRPFIWLKENMNLSHPTICLLSSSVHVSLTNLFLDSVAVGERLSEYLSNCKGEAEVAFSWLWAQRKGLVFPAVSDCSRPAECKHALMCGAVLDTADTAQAVSAHEVWGLAWPIVPLFWFSLPWIPTHFHKPLIHHYWQCEIDIL